MFLLCDVFGYTYDEVAAIIGKTPAACRQLAVRARRHLSDDRPRFDASRQERDELVRRFVAAAEEGELDELVELLAPDVTFTGDGGGKAMAFPRPVHGVESVSKLVRVAFAKVADLGLQISRVHVGGQPGMRVHDTEDRTMAIWSFVISDGLITAIHGVVNPDKLAHLQRSGHRTIRADGSRNGFTTRLAASRGH